MIQNLAAEDVLLIHEVLVRDFAQTPDPISPPGVKDLGLLQSAIGRQHVSYAGQDKYRTPVEAAATLMFGICNNHPFFNGNKRTALVAMLAHLDKNGLTLMGTRQNDLHDMIMAVANHTIVAHTRFKAANPKKPSADDEVAAIAKWIGYRADKPRRGEKQITYRELGRILRNFGFDLRVPASGRGNHRDVVRFEQRTTGVFKKHTETIEKRIGSIGYKDEGTFVVLSDLKKVRELCGLREEDGVTSAAFYDDAAIIDAFVNRYRGVLNRLAKK